MKNIALINRIILGLVMLIPGLLKLMSPAGVTGMLSGIGFPAATLFTWILILSEIVFGLAILANYKLKLTTIPPMIILLIATLLVHINWSGLATTAWPNVLIHLAVISNYWLLGHKHK